MAKAPYQQTDGYIPRTDSGFRDWLENFSNLISADPGKFGLTAADATVIANHFDDYSAVYSKVQSGATRTPALVGQKDAQRAAAVASSRVYAMQIKLNLGVDNEDKIALGIHVNDPTPTPIPAPTSAPILAIVSAFSGEHQIRFADENTPASRRKPPGVTQMELFVHVGPQPIVNWDDAKSVGVYTKNPILYTFNPEKAGQTATYFARWRTAKGLDGPMSLPVAMQIAFGGPVDQAIPTGGTAITGDDQLKIAA